MGNIFNYLEWRGDLSLKTEPFNDVDNVVLSELSYVDFSELVPENGEALLSDVREKYFGQHLRSLIRDDSYHILSAPLLMDGMASGERFSGAKLADYVNIIDREGESQMAAVTVLLDDGSAYVSFRGTDTTIVGWKEDFNMSFMPVTEGQRRATEYLDRVGRETGRKLRVGGHSKGGNFAIYASAFCSSEVRDKVIEVYSNDGPGFRKEIMESDEYKAVLPKVKSIVPATSVIGMLLASDVSHEFVRSSSAGINQHDVFTWEVDRNRLVSTEPSNLGIFIRRSQQDWLSKLSDEEREDFVNALFSILESTGMDTLDEIYSQKLKSLEKIRGFLKEMPKPKQKEMNRVIGELIASGRDIALSEIEKRRKK